MNVNRILVMVAVALFVITAISAYSDDINVNETGFLALGLAAYAASGLTFGVRGGLGSRRRR
ncbi:MAG: hypothetical protein ABR540_08230 [Acidimicrobiales bacterium]|nr:hypothetical protein [Actinomycetota bacterium]